MLKPYYIYRHIRPDTNEVFYVGKGTNTGGYYDYSRSREKLGRNAYWHNIVNKCGGSYEVEIVMEFDTPEKCTAKEKEFISLYGRSNLGLGSLCNLTDGGDGSWGLVVSKEERKRRSEAVRGENHPNWGKRLSEETCQRKSRSLSGEKHHLFGKTLPEQWKENIAASKIGEQNPMFGKTGIKHHGTKRVIDTETGRVYFGAKEAAEAAGVSVSIMYQYLDGTRKNKTSMVREAT